jgi:hypothetical protein
LVRFLIADLKVSRVLTLAFVCALVCPSCPDCPGSERYMEEAVCVAAVDAVAGITELGHGVVLHDLAEGSAYKQGLSTP